LILLHLIGGSIRGQQLYIQEMSQAAVHRIGASFWFVVRQGRTRIAVEKKMLAEVRDSKVDAVM